MKTKSEEMSPGPHHHPPPARWKIVAAFAAIYLIWGSTYLAIRFGVETLPPFLMAGTRFLAAGLVLCAIARVRGADKPTLPQWRDAAIAGGLMLMIGNGGVSWAEQFIPSGVAALLVALVPLWMVLVDWARPNGKRPTLLILAGLAVGFGGVALLARGNGHGSGPGYGWGVAALMVGSICWAIGSVFNRHAQKPSSPLLAIGMQMFAGGALLLILSAAANEFSTFSPGDISRKSFGAWLYLTLVGSLIGFTAYIWLLQVSTPARVSTYAYVNPFVAVLLGATLGNETLSPALFVAGGLIIVAVALIVYSGSRTTKPKVTGRSEAIPPAGLPEQR